MSYESPIEIYRCMNNQLENDVVNVVRSYGISVDKDELIKALEYDRGQYQKGYEDAKKDMIEARKWISVREALPNSDWVLGQIREKDSGYLWIPRQVEYRESRDDWYEESIGWFKEDPDHAFEVIAWMPLPEVYRGE